MTSAPGPRCPLCKGDNIEVNRVKGPREDEMTITVYCQDCDAEIEYKIGGIKSRSEQDGGVS